MIRYSNSLIFNGRYLIMSCSSLIPTCKYLLSNILPWKLQLGLISFGSSLHLFQLLINPCLWGFWQKHFCPIFCRSSWKYIYIYIYSLRPIFFCLLFHFETSQNIVRFLKIKVINLLMFLLYIY